MLQITEIYVCRNERKLSEGHLQYSREIRNRSQALEDAMEVCARDATIRRIAYYAIDDIGESRLLLSFANPGFVERPQRRTWRPPHRRHAWRPASGKGRQQRSTQAWGVWARAYARLTSFFAQA